MKQMPRRSSSFDGAKKGQHMSPRAESNQRQSRRANLHPRPNHRRKRGNGHLNGNGAGHNGASHADVPTNGSEITTETTTSTKLSREDYVMHFRWAGQKSVEGIIQQGYWLEQASKNLKGEYEKMLVEDLRLSTGKARKLRAVERHPVLANRSNWNALPPCWTTLYQLSLIRPERLEALIEEGEVHAGLEYEKACKLYEDTKKKKGRKRHQPSADPPAQESSPARAESAAPSNDEDEDIDPYDLVRLADDIEAIFNGSGNGKPTLGRRLDSLLDRNADGELRRDVIEELARHIATATEKLNLLRDVATTARPRRRA
jgi:hypothetical protein